MMKLEDQVVSLELSQKLKQLKVRVDSHFVWRTSTERYLAPVPQLVPSLTHRVDKYANQWNSSPAYTVAELGSMLPTDIGKWMLCASKSQGGWVMSYEDSCFKRLDGVGIFREIEADARALMLIWLIENGHLSVEEVNGEG